MIEVRIDYARVTKIGNEVIFGVEVLGKLKEAGIPVEGVLFPRAVTRGTLSLTVDPVLGDHVYQWSEDAGEAS
jgi:hypothetical protein